MRVHLCGVRGSTPAPGADFLHYGGHTSCVAISHDDQDAPTLILDAGTGLRSVTALLDERPFEGTILLSHLHWDHVQGLPFFSGGDHENARVHLMLPAQADGSTAETVLERAISPPHFPMTPSQLRGSWTFADATPGTWGCEGFEVLAREIPHKGGRTFGYRVSDGRSVFAYMPDHCPTSLGPGPDGWGEYHEAALELASDADMLVHDAQLLTLEELASEGRFGHAFCDYPVELARRAGAREVVLFHHRPDRTDEELDELARGYEGTPAVAPAIQDAILRL